MRFLFLLLAFAIMALSKQHELVKRAYLLWQVTVELNSEEEDLVVWQSKKKPFRGDINAIINRPKSFKKVSSLRELSMGSLIQNSSFKGDFYTFSGKLCKHVLPVEFFHEDLEIDPVIGALIMNLYHVKYKCTHTNRLKPTRWQKELVAFNKRRRAINGHPLSVKQPMVYAFEDIDFNSVKQVKNFIRFNFELKDVTFEFIKML